MGKLVAGLRLLAVPAAIFLVVTAGTLAWRDSGWMQVLEGQVLDGMFQVRGPVIPHSDTLVVAIDDRSVGHLGGWPIDRAVLARLVRMLDDVDAAAIGLDLLLLEGRRGEDGVLVAGDRALVEAAADADRLVLPFAVTHGEPGTAAQSDSGIRRSAYITYVQGPATADNSIAVDGMGLLVPFAELGEVTNVGHVSVPIEPDGAVRRWTPVVGYGDRRYPAMAVELARLYLGLDRADVLWVEGDGLWLGGRFVPVDQAGGLAINEYGPARTFQTVALVDLLTGRVPAHIARNRIVLIGATATGVGDSYVTALDRQMPGVELIANMTQNLVHGETLVRNAVTFGLSMALLAGFTALSAGLAWIRLPQLLLVGVGAMLALWAFAVFAAFDGFGLWLDAVPMVAAILATGLWALVRRLVLDRRDRVAAQARSQALARFVAPALADRLAARDHALTDVHEREAAVMFIDLVGFTQATEHMPAAETMPLLTRFYRLVEAATDAHRGIVDKFMGDGAMALFGINGDPGKAAADALLCAIRLVEDFAGADAAAWSLGPHRLSVSIGIHYGPVALAEVGGHRQVQFTATGDTVNVASRLEELTRDLATPLVVSDDAIAAARDTLPAGTLERFVPLPQQPLRGRSRTLAAWALRNRVLGGAVVQGAAVSAA